MHKNTLQHFQVSYQPERRVYRDHTLNIDAVCWSWLLSGFIYQAGHPDAAQFREMSRHKTRNMNIV